jgi:hypothetical protein
MAFIRPNLATSLYSGMTSVALLGSWSGKPGHPHAWRSISGLPTTIDAGLRSVCAGVAFNTTQCASLWPRTGDDVSLAYLLSLLEAGLAWYSLLASSAMPPSRSRCFNHDWWLAVKPTIPRAIRKGLATTTLLTSWMLWKHRNGCVFDGDKPSTRRLNDHIHAEAKLWARAWANGLRVILPNTWDVH